MSTDKDPKPMFQFLTTGVVKEDADDKFPKAQAHSFKGPGVVRNRVASKKISINKQIEDEVAYGLGPGVIKGDKK